jgi:myo-inositol-1(or 4)-monophosphatase
LGRQRTSDAGHYLNGEPLRSTGHRAEAEALIVTGYPSARDVATDGSDALTRFGDLVAAYGTLRRSGSAALSLAQVAAGWIDAAMGTSVNAWDICAGRLIVEQAGGVYRGFGADGWNQPGYAAHSPDLDPAALDRFVATFAE